MKTNVYNLQGEVVNNVDLNDEIFGVVPRKDILDRVVQWQLAKRRSGNHKTKGVSEVAGSGKKIYRQKGTGGARHGSKRGNVFRGGGIIFGPVVRDHGYSLQKKVRRLGLIMALSDKFKNDNLVIVDNLKVDSMKTKDTKNLLIQFGEKQKLLLIDNDNINENLFWGISNLPYVDVLLQIGANVYDIVKKDKVIISFDALNSLQARLAG